jgi:hypothetical protein
MPNHGGGHGGSALDGPSINPLSAIPGYDTIISFLGGEDAVADMMVKLQTSLRPKIGPMMEKFAPFAVSLLATQKAFKVEEIPPVLRKDAKRVRLTYGPYILKGAQVRRFGILHKSSQLTLGQDPKRYGNSFSLDPSGTGYLYTVEKDFPTDITILDAFSYVADDKMKEIDRKDGLYNHHNVFIDLSSTPSSLVGCGGEPFASVPVKVFLGGSADIQSYRYTTQDGKFNSGLYLKKDAPIMQMLDIVNYNNETQKVYTVSELEYYPGKPEGFLQGAMGGIDLGMCSGKSGMIVQAPKGTSKFTFGGKEMTIGRDGYFLSLHGHMHDGGTEIVVKLNGKDICVSKAIYGGVGHEGVSSDGKPWTSLGGMTTCEETIRVKKGDKLGLEAHFDMEKHPA